MKNAILINVEGGIVQGVTSNIKDLEVFIVDYDDQSENQSVVSSEPAEFCEWPLSQCITGDSTAEVSAKQQLQEMEVVVLNNYTLISEDEFIEKYKPIKNHFESRNGAWNDTEFETFGKELEYVLEYFHKHPLNVWTHIECDADCILSGMHFVNRMGFFITEVPVESGQPIEVTVEGVGAEEGGARP